MLKAAAGSSQPPASRSPQHGPSVRVTVSGSLWVRLATMARTMAGLSASHASRTQHEHLPACLPPAGARPLQPCVLQVIPVVIPPPSPSPGRIPALVRRSALATPRASPSQPGQPALDPPRTAPAGPAEYCVPVPECAALARGYDRRPSARLHLSPG